MEENQNIESVNAPEETNDTSARELQPESPAPEVSGEVRHTRKNGRNRSGIRSSNGSASAQSTRELCGELENPSEFREKLSGSNVGGYAEGEGYQERRGRPERSDRRERGQRKFHRHFDDAEQGEEASNEAEASETPEVPEHNGPSFESGKFTPRAVEVELSDRRPKFRRESNADDGVVSYTPEDNKCSISLFERIKTILKSVFGGKDKSKKQRKGGNNNRRGGKKNWSNSRDGGKRYNNNRRGGKGGYNKRRYNDRRPGGGKGAQGGSEA